jgi:ATP-dependent DNA ligase
MLSSRLEDPGLLADARYVAEPKLDGQRAQVHVVGGRTVRVYSRPGRDLLQHRGLGWLGDVRWPVDQAVLDGELFAGEGIEGVDAVLAARGRGGGAVAFAAFDVLRLDGHDVMAEPWADRRKRLEDLVGGGGLPAPRVQLVPVSTEPSRLWVAWVVDRGGEGIVLKDRASPYRPGTRSRAWWKLKQKFTLDVEVLACVGELIPWGDWGQACILAFAYTDPRTDERVSVEQAVRIAAPATWTPRRGPGEILCWGVLRSGLLRHPVFTGWR